MDLPKLQAPAGFLAATTLDLLPMPTLADLGLQRPGRTVQVAGEPTAHSTLRSFLHEPDHDYARSLSSPLPTVDGCSRLSPHLAFGTLSLRTVHHVTEKAIARCTDRSVAHALRGFAGRLRWHCHFMQKLEDKPQID